MMRPSLNAGSSPFRTSSRTVAGWTPSNSATSRTRSAARFLQSSERIDPRFLMVRRRSTRQETQAEGFENAMAAPSNPQRGSPRRTTRRVSLTRLESTRETFGKRGGVRPQRVDSSPPNLPSRRPLFRWQPTSFRRFRRLSKAASLQQDDKLEVSTLRRRARSTTACSRDSYAESRGWRRSK